MLTGLFLIAGCAGKQLDPYYAGRVGAAGATVFPTPTAPSPEPHDAAFYAQPAAATLREADEGQILRYRRIQPQAYYLFDVHAHAWQLVYRSNDTHGKPVANVATVLVPPEPRRVLLSYQTAYDALTTECAPSQEILEGNMIEQFLVDKALDRGWVVVLPDYEGPHAQFGAGVNAGRAVLDGIRATLNFLPADLVNLQTPVGLWGYSGGGYASLWAGQLQADYAPELAIAGIAAGGAPADLESTAEHLDGGFFAGIYFAAAIGLSRAYPDIELESLLNEAGERMVADLDESCVGQELALVKDPLLSGYFFDEMADYVTVPAFLEHPAVEKVLAENRLGQHRLSAPLFYYHARFDQINPREDARTLMRTYCRQGTAVVYDIPFAEHLLAALTGASAAVDYLAARFAGEPAPDGCDEISGDPS